MLVDRSKSDWSLLSFALMVAANAYSNEAYRARRDRDPALARHFDDRARWCRNEARRLERETQGREVNPAP